jgi:DNA-binding CsgD family transcriptional regulator
VLANLTAATRSLLRLVSSGELTRLLDDAPRSDGPGHKAQKRLSSDDLVRMVADYGRGDCTTYDLAERYGVHRNTVSAHLRARGLKPGHQPLSPDEATQVRTLRDQGLSLNAIGRAIGRDPKTVKAAGNI